MPKFTNRPYKNTIKDNLININNISIIKSIPLYIEDSIEYIEEPPGIRNIKDGNQSVSQTANNTTNTNTITNIDILKILFIVLDRSLNFFAKVAKVILIQKLHHSYLLQTYNTYYKLMR
jgi:hypothetical protein